MDLTCIVVVVGFLQSYLASSAIFFNFAILHLNGSCINWCSLILFIAMFLAINSIFASGCIMYGVRSEYWENPKPFLLVLLNLILLTITILSFSCGTICLPKFEKDLLKSTSKPSPTGIWTTITQGDTQITCVRNEDIIDNEFYVTVGFLGFLLVLTVLYVVAWVVAWCNRRQH